MGEEGIQTRMPLNGKIGQCDLVFVWQKLIFYQLILLFNLFLLLFMGPITLFDTIHKSHCTILITF